jgi:hypothetical protein
VPGAIIPVARNSGPMGASLAPLPRAGDFNVAQIEINELRMQIKKILLDESLPPEQFKPRSATEIAERMKDLAQNLGSAFGRLLTETMIPIVKRVLSIMDKQGLIDLPLKVNGLEVKMIPISPLAKAQNLDDVSNMVDFFQITQALGPGGQATVKPDAVADYIAKKMNIPANVLTTAEERQMIEEQSKAMMQMMAQQQQQGQQGQQQPQGQPAIEGEVPAEGEVPEGNVETMKA